jgi:hypothetical protein
MLLNRIVIGSAVLLLFVNGFLFWKFLAKRNFAEQSMSVLAHNDQWNQYLLEKLESDKSVHSALKKYLDPPSANRIVHADAEFVKALQALKVVVAEDSLLSTKEFFGIPMTLNDSLQTMLWIAQAEFKESIAHLQTHEQENISFYQKIYVEHRDQLRKIAGEMDRTRSGVKKHFTYNIVLIDDVQPIEIVGYKDDDYVEWNDNYSVACKYLEKLAFFKTALQSRQLKDRLYRLEQAFPEKGKIKVYSKTYDLSHISHAELRSVYKYLWLIKIEIDALLLDVKL